MDTGERVIIAAVYRNDDIHVGLAGGPLFLRTDEVFPFRMGWRCWTGCNLDVGSTPVGGLYRFPALLSAVPQEMKQRVHVRSGNVGIRLEIECRIEIRRGRPPLFRSIQDVMEERVDAGASHVLIARQIPFTIKGRVGKPPFETAKQQIMR